MCRSHSRQILVLKNLVGKSIDFIDIISYTAYIMVYPTDIKEKMEAAYGLLGQNVISVDAFEKVRALLKGYNPALDRKLEFCSKAFNEVQKIHAGDIAVLTAETLPEQSEEQKKRKKALLFFIETIKDLQSEIKRVENEISAKDNKAWHWGRIIKFAKGPFGLITLAALVIVAGMFVLHQSTTQTAAHIRPKTSLQVIIYQDKKLPLSQLYVGHGSDCDSPHYHATNGKVTALDGSIVLDPEGCGFGRTKDVQVVAIDQ